MSTDDTEGQGAVPVTVRVPGLLAGFTGDDRHVALAADTVRGAVDALVDLHPALEPHLLADDGTLRTHLQLFHDGRRVAWADAADEPLVAGAEVLVFQAVSGG